MDCELVMEQSVTEVAEQSRIEKIGEKQRKNSDIIAQTPLSQKTSMSNRGCHACRCKYMECSLPSLSGRITNTVVVSAITPYQLVRLFTTPIILVDSIETTAMVNSGAMGNFIHPQFVKEHKLVTKTCTPLIVNDVNCDKMA